MNLPRVFAIATHIAGRPIIGFCYMLLASILSGQSSPITSSRRPNFTGTWKLNLQLSGPVMPRGLEALVIDIDHRDPVIRSAEIRKVAGKVTKGASSATIDGIEHVTQSAPQKSVKEKKWWSADALMMHWEMTEDGTTYISDIKQTLSGDGMVLTMSERYREPGMERIRDWVFEKQ